MTNEAGIVRTFHGLREARETVDGLLREFYTLPPAPFSAHPRETHNLLVAARYVLDGAIRRDRNVGLHFNADLADAESPNSVESTVPAAAVSPTPAG